MRKADHYGSIKRAKRQKNRFNNAKKREDYIAKINTYRAQHRIESRFKTNEAIARRIGLNIETCKAIGVFEMMDKRLPKKQVQYPPTVIDVHPMNNFLRHPFTHPSDGAIPVLVLAGVMSSRGSHK